MNLAQRFRPPSCPHRQTVADVPADLPLFSCGALAVG
jgi:hypothetical protein